MRKLITILFIALVGALQAQVKTIEGQLTDRNGNPLSNTSFYVKDRNIYGKTDKKGNFTLKNVMENDIIIVADGNNINRAFNVSGFNAISTTEAPSAPPQIESLTDTVGVKFILPEGQNINYYGVDKIASIKKDESGNYHIKPPKEVAKYSGYNINFTTFVEANNIGRLPKLQSQYAQSESGSLIDGLPSELFSWGEPISESSYDAADFFRTGISFGNTLDMKFPSISRRGLASLGLGQKRNNSPIPNAYSDSYNASFSVSDFETGNFNSTAGVMYRNTTDNLMQQGSNLSSLMYSIFSTPPSFDNAYNKTQSYAPDFVQNPFWLVNELPDKKKNDYLATYARTKYGYKKITANAGLSFDKNWQKRKDGLLIFPSNHFTDRKANETNLTATADFSYKIFDDNKKKLSITPLSYGFRRTENEVMRLDSDFLTQQNKETNTTLDRNAHDLKYSTKMNYKNILMIDVQNSHYFSNTLQSSSYTNIFPKLSFHWKMYGFLNDILFNPNRWNRWHSNQDLSLRGSLSRSIGESPLVYSNLAALSTTGKAADFRTYYEYTDIFHHRDLNAEIYTKGNISLSWYYKGNISAEINYFNNKTKDYILPVLNGGQNFILENLGEVRNSGYEISLNYRYNSYREIASNITLNFSRAKSKVTDVYGDFQTIPIAGFSDVAAVFAKNESLGAIYGTTYLRNEFGYIVLDENGLPLVDGELRKIGDPTPDFVMSLVPNFNWRSFELSLVMEYSHGGERWNGTRAYLDYLGVSEESGINRNELTQSRLTNYGAAGVGEKYIEKATYFRLADVSLFYTHKINNTIFKEIKVGVSARNLLLVTGYKGVEPTLNLFGYSAGGGLDLFNLPSVRTYTFTASVKF